jgi:4-amino-4-deoxy-L-arabinose transferase-like glycosyltransferase
MASFAMRIFGINIWSQGVVAIALAGACLLLFLKILKNLIDEKTAILAGLIYVLFPLTGYFGTGAWDTLLGLSSIWFYLVLIGAVREKPEPGIIHKIGLALSLFFVLQFGWPGFFYCLAIGVHYIFRCIHQKKLPDKVLLSILLLSPFLSLALNFTIMAGGYGWDIQKIIDLYKWRSAKGEMPEFLWGAWFARVWKHSTTNFTLPILISAIAYFTIGQLFVFSRPGDEQEGRRFPRKFPQFWLFFMVPMSQLFILRGALWQHQTWLMPWGPFMAIAAAQAIMLLTDVFKKVNVRLAVGVFIVVLGLFAGFCMAGTNYYYNVRWQAPEKLRMFQRLNEKIPPDKALLSFEDLIVDQHSSKGAFYRPEIAWYLDREIVQADSLDQIESLAKTGKYPYYLIPHTAKLQPLISQLMKLYTYEYVPGVEGELRKDEFFRAGMHPYFIFDLSSRAANQ